MLKSINVYFYILYCFESSNDTPGKTFITESPDPLNMCMGKHLGEPPSLEMVQLWRETETPIRKQRRRGQRPI